MHPPIPVTSPRGTNTGQQSWARARAIRLRHAKRSTTARTWIVFVFLFLPCSPVSQVHSRVQTRRDAPIFKRAIVAAASDCRFENRSPASGGNSNPRETTSSMKVGTFAVLSGIKFDLINRKELELIFIFFFFHSYSFNQSWEFLFGFLLDSFWSDLGDWGIRFRKFKKTAIDEIRHVLKEQCDSF